MFTYPVRINLCGIGGQGIILMAVMLGTAAVHKGMYAVQTQSYGSEARGGQCQATLIVDKEKIQSPVAEKMNIVIAMFQDAYKKHIDTLEDGGILFTDSDLVSEIDKRNDIQMYSVPATQIALDTGNRMAANMVMLGYVSKILDLFTIDELEEVVRTNVKEKFVDINLRAMQAGFDYAVKSMQKG